MSENASITRGEQVRSKVPHAAAKLFLEKGFTESRMGEISTLAGVSYGSMMFIFRSKEEILSELVGFVLDGQFEATTKMLTVFGKPTVSGGSFEKIGVYSAIGTLADILEDGYYFYDSDGIAIATEGQSRTLA